MINGDQPPFSDQDVEADIDRYIYARKGGRDVRGMGRMLTDLQSYYAPREHQESLARIWQRLQERKRVRANRTLALWFKKANVSRCLGVAALLTTIALVVGKALHLLIQHRKKWARPSASLVTTSR